MGQRRAAMRHCERSEAGSGEQERTEAWSFEGIEASLDKMSAPFAKCFAFFCHENLALKVLHQFQRAAESKFKMCLDYYAGLQM